MRDVGIRDEVIRLGQLLKFSGLVDSGAEAKLVLTEGRVRVNGAPEARRGRQLRAGDVVELELEGGGGEPVRIVAGPAG